MFKRALLALLWLGVALPSDAQQILCERVYSWPLTQNGLYAYDLLRLPSDSLRLLADFQNGTGGGSLPTRTRLFRVQVGICDTLPTPNPVFTTQNAFYRGTQGIIARRGQVLIASANNAASQPIQLRLFDRSGQLRWLRTLPLLASYPELGGLLEAPDRGFFVGFGGGAAGKTYLVRLDSLGNIVWQKILSRQKSGGPMHFCDPAYTRTGSIVFHALYPANGTVPSAGVMEINQNGDSLSTRSTSPMLTQTGYFDYSLRNNLLPLRDGGFIATAIVDSATTNNYRPFLTRLDVNLNVVWSSLYRQYGTQRYVFSHPYELADGTLVVLANPTNVLLATYYLFRYSASGILLQRYAFTSPLVASFANTGFATPVGLQPLPDSTFMLVSNLRASASSPQRTYLAHLKVAGLRRVVDSHYIPAANSPLAARASIEVSLALGEPHPNPASETVTLSYQLPKGITTAKLVLYDLTGRQIATQPLRENQGEVHVSVRAVASGLYLGALEVDGRVLAKRKLAVAH
jgi:hypothetical protein